jgi:hypothetical protein
MNMRLLLFFSFFLTSFAFSQAPQRLNYQSIVRDETGELVASQKIDVRISILQGSEVGAAVYTETHNLMTNENGLATFGIGEGVTADVFANIDWGTGPFFIKTETAPEGGANYTISGVSQLMSVPYALYATKSGVAPGTAVGDMQYWDGTKWVMLPKGNEGQSLTIKDGVPTWASAPISTPQKHYRGEVFGGGIVFWISEDSLHGLIAETIDLTSIDGMCTYFDAQTLINKQIYQSAKGSNFFDWRIPSLGELQKLYMYQTYFTGISKTNPYYWSSTPYNATGGMYTYNFDNNTIGYSSSSNTANLRTVRNF